MKWQIFFLEEKRHKFSTFQAEGKPDPEILWFKHDAPVIQSSSVKVVNDGTELRINR